MKIKRETITTVMIDDTRALMVGDTVKFIANGDCKFGAFMGVTNRGALMFEAKVGNTETAFNVMPVSIEDIEVIEHEI